MQKILNEMCAEIRNWFELKSYGGTFAISNGMITPHDFLKDGQYFRICGSVFNDGVHLFSSSFIPTLTDETFDGTVWAMAVPPAVIALAGEIKEYKASGEGNATAIVSESVGGHSVSRATGKDGTPATGWERVFAKRLNKWRKI